MAFYDASQTLLLRLTLHKKNGLYYYPIDTVATDTSPVRTQISQAAINDYMDQLDAGLGDNDHIPSSFAPSPTFCLCLPSICETTEFSPILDPLAEQSFHDAPSHFSRSNVDPDSLDNEKPPPCSRLRRCPIQLAQQLKSEL